MRPVFKFRRGTQWILNPSLRSEHYDETDHEFVGRFYLLERKIFILFRVPLLICFPNSSTGIASILLARFVMMTIKFTSKYTRRTFAKERVLYSYCSQKIGDN